MYVITNRHIHTDASGVDLLGRIPSEKGPHELRALRATRRGRGWQLELLPDELPAAMKRELKIPVGQKAWASRYVAEKVLADVRRKKRNLVLFVHGFNNNVEAVLDRAERLEETYDVEVLPFSWPADGGGASGALSYKSDKRDARASAGAVYRFLGKARAYLDLFNALMIERIQAKAIERYPLDLESRQIYLATELAKGCPFRVTLLLHSMGNYLYKQIQRSEIYDDHHMLCDNVVLAAADTNNKDHSQWIERIRCRGRIFVTINEDDRALRASRLKGGEEQRARLGHYIHHLDARGAHYVNVTGAPKVGGGHAYFEGKPVASANSNLHRFFREALNGGRGEKYLHYHESSHTWEVRRA